MSVLSVGRSPVYPFALDIVDMMVPFCWRWLQEQPDGISSAHPYLCRQLSPCPMSDATNRICCELRQGRTHCCWHWGTSLGALCDMKIHTSSLQVLSGKQAFPTWNMVWSCLMAISWFQRRCFACFAIAKWDYLGQESESRYFSEQNDGKPWDWSAPIFQSKPINPIV